MKICCFSERPYQDPRIMGVTLTDLDLSNDIYDAQLSADLFDRYLDEKVYAEEVGFDMLMLTEPLRATGTAGPAPDPRHRYCPCEA